MGGFNVNVGKYHQGDDEVLGRFGYGERNDRCIRLVQFAMANDMYVSNTYFEKKVVESGHGDLQMDQQRMKLIILSPTREASC